MLRREVGVANILLYPGAALEPVGDEITADLTAMKFLGGGSEFSQSSIKLFLDLLNRHQRSEHSLARTEEVEYLGIRGTGVDAVTVGGDRHFGPVAFDVLAHVLDRLANLAKDAAIIADVTKPLLLALGVAAIFAERAAAASPPRLKTG